MYRSPGTRVTPPPPEKRPTRRDRGDLISQIKAQTTEITSAVQEVYLNAGNLLTRSPVETGPNGEEFYDAAKLTDAQQINISTNIRQVGQRVGSAASRITSLTDQLTEADAYSKLQAQTEKFKAQSNEVAVTAYPMSTLPQILLPVGAGLFAAGSAILGLRGIGPWWVNVAWVSLYVLGVFLLGVATWIARVDDKQRWRVWRALFENRLPDGTLPVNQDP
ncbi:MAG: hypothetical protein JRN35_10745 [Nitrososphaerota archaeon]|nr:hypothetical protein [Nitrososphaerota archaeon]